MFFEVASYVIWLAMRLATYIASNYKTVHLLKGILLQSSGWFTKASTIYVETCSLNIILFLKNA